MAEAMNVNSRSSLGFEGSCGSGFEWSVNRTEFYAMIPSVPIGDVLPNLPYSGMRSRRFCGMFCNQRIHGFTAAGSPFKILGSTPIKFLILRCL